MASALELLNNKGRDIPLVSQYFGPFAFGLMGLSTALLGNYGKRRPLFSGLQKHILFTAVGAGFGWWLENVRSNYLAEKDAMLRHYVELHPEDFPDPVRKKYSEVLKPWIPVR